MFRRDALSVESRLLGLAAALAVPLPASADQILEVHSPSLTTYVPTSKSNVQDVRPLFEQRGVHVDGSLRAGSAQGMALSGNPSGDAWNGNASLSGVNLFAGTFAVNDVDISLPASVPWIIGRSYNCRQKDGGSYFASNGYQGKNWFQISQPELVFHDSSTNSEDMIYLIYGADRFIEFRRADASGQGDSTSTFNAVNGAAGAILLHTFDGIDLATYYDQSGTRFDFFWFGDGDIDDDIEGSIWRIMDSTITVNPYLTSPRLTTSDGNVAYVGDVGNPNTALSNGYNATSGAITTAYDSAGRRFTYDDTSGRLDYVTAELNSGGWVEVARVDYSYYVAADAHGEDGDLELVTITTPLTDSGISIERNKHYWYYEGTYDATNNPGYHHQIRYIIDFEGYRKYDWLDSTWNDTPLGASEGDLKPYASASFKYDTERRIKSGWFNGACGCAGAASGEHLFEYEANGGYSDNAGYDTAWKSRTIARKPDVTYKTASGAIKSYVTQYFDEAGQPLHRVFTDDDPDNTSPAPKVWATKVIRSSSGLVTDIHTPANVTAYTHSSASFTTSSSDGLARVINRESSGDLKGFVDDDRHRKGSGTAYFDDLPDRETRTLTVGDVGLTRPLVKETREYTAESELGTTGYYATTYAYTYHSDTAALVQYLTPKRVTTTFPTVSTGQNGSGSANTSKHYLRKDGTVAFTEAEDGIFTYAQYSAGQLIKRIDDVKTNGTFPSGDDPTDFSITESGDGSDRTTTYTYDNQGRLETTTLPDGGVLKHYYSKLADGRLVSLAYSDYETSPSTKFFGPVQYTVSNHAGRAEVQATVALTNNESTAAITSHVDETDADPITAMDLGTVARLSVNIYDEAGTTVEKSRLYFDIPGSGEGSDGTNYDQTEVGYDDQGRRYRVKAPHGTISRTDFDTLGRVVRQWTGTNDNAFDGGSSGTDNMVKILENAYDSGNDEGNSYLTKRTAFVEDGTTGKRETIFAHDVRGRVLLQTNPTAPHVFNKVDNLGRLVASGQFGSTASIVVGTDDPTTETANRLGLSQTFYDERGRVWKTQRHKIDDADGSDDDTLQSLSWFDAAGRLIKQHGAQLTKTAYDRLGRTTRRYTITKDTDSAYGDADDVSGDLVLLEQQTVYESTNSDDVLMTVAIERYHDDKGAGQTTGALDTNADGDDLLVTASNLEGRAQITANWYDDFGRLTSTVRYGTNGGANFDRDGLSIPTRSDTALRTDHAYYDDGALKSLTDPKSLETRYVYDEAGRQVTVIANYVNGTPSGVNGDDDVHTRFVYTDGLRTKLWVDLDGDNVEDATDQVTTYTYGTTKGTSAGDSKIATGHLLKEAKYPDSSGANDVVSFAYNAQGQEIWRKDQAGSVIEIDFDDGGREIHRRVSTLASGFDGAVRRISTTYDSLGRRQLVSQYDNATVGQGTVKDEVKFTHDDWGNLEKLEQDHNSAVGASGSVDDLEVSYTWAKTTSSTGWKTLRRTGGTLPDGTSLTYRYLSTSDRFDQDVSRLSTLSVGTVEVAEYWYNGVGSLVGTIHNEPDIFWKMYGSSGSYPDLDQFNRITSSRWTKDLSTDLDFFDLDVTYDRNSNIELVEDNIHVQGPGVDVDYVMDNLNRLTRAEQGTWNGSAITSRKHDQQWTLLDQVGNWDLAKLDVNGDGDFVDSSEYNDDRTHNVVNELTARDTDDNGTDNYTLTYDAVGNLTDDAEHYEYEYDAFGRLRKIKNQSSVLVVEYKYNGLGHRICWHYDVDADGTVESTSDDPRYYFAYDERWRIVATYRDDDSTSDLSDEGPKERFVYHAAGLSGLGGSSYIDNVILRDKDANTAWSAASDGTLEERIYYCHNWRGDISVLINAAGEMVEWVKYSAYGIPFGIPVGDTNSDGTVNSSDGTNIIIWWGSSTKPTGDTNLDGTINSTDQSKVTTQNGTTLGWWKLSHKGNRKGYAGYEADPNLADAIWHVRHRVLNSDLGRWTRRDPLGYVDGPNAYQCAISNPILFTDPSGRDCPGCDTEQIDWVIELIEDICAQGCPGLPPGLQWPLDLPSFNESQCALRCCAQHDDCFHDSDCSALSSWPATVLYLLLYQLGNPIVPWTPCITCNTDMLACIVLCSLDENWNSDQPPCYCPATGQFWWPDPGADDCEGEDAECCDNGDPTPEPPGVAPPSHYPERLPPTYNPPNNPNLPGIRPTRYDSV